MKLAPIVLFAYNRPVHLQRTLDALKTNILAKQSMLFIYVDGKKQNIAKEESEGIHAVKILLDKFMIEQNNNPMFDSINITYQKYNLGLADSIIYGVSEVMKQFGKAIILEDDILTSPVFLNYMNDALNRYENEAKVWSIAAWSYPIDTVDLGDSYFWRSPHCWGWASWADRWQHFKRDTQWALENFDQKDINYINIDGSANYFNQLIANHQNKIKTWAIYNYLIAYKHSALTLCPSIPYVKQIGFDGSGVHCNEGSEILNSVYINTKFPITYPEQITESHLAFERIKAFELSLHKPILIRIINKIRRIIRILPKKLKAFYPPS